MLNWSVILGKIAFPHPRMVLMSPLQMGAPRGQDCDFPSDRGLTRAVLFLPSDWGSLRARLCPSTDSGSLKAGLCLPLDGGFSKIGLCLPSDWKKVKVWVTQSCLTLCHPLDCSPPGSSVHGILQARRLEWVAMPSSGHLPDPGIEHGPPTMRQVL